MVNAYLNIIRAVAPAGILIMDTFFYQSVVSFATDKTKEFGLDQMLRYTKKVSFIIHVLLHASLNTLIKMKIFHHDVLIFPMNINNRHWVASTVDLVNRHVAFFDSLEEVYADEHHTWYNVSGQYKSV